MLSRHYGSLIRKERLARGLTQTAVASTARVSRTILSQLEQGKPHPVQTDVLDRIFQALGIDPTAGDPGPGAAAILEERRRARLEHQLKLERQRVRHLRLAAELTANPKKARQQIAAAKNRVGLWARNRTCSPLYIKRWTELLALSPGELARRMASLGEWEDALFQNTPWSSEWI
ncbi:MAG: hypothetical protein A3H35_00975 [Betaproteobacteria bacterium RIFCSPLOWO2_02_FULL_62_17]|nr:MAG: hypothetical protein A3H35_00975 [Betaproteobacteria bacterium RIFCSPLOWO2_02_FULL_62_17]